MKEYKKRNFKVGSLVAGMSVVGALCGWIAYAGEIETDVNNNVQAIAAQEAKLAIDPSNAQRMQSVGNSVELIQNGMVKQDLYGTAPNNMAPADAVITNHFQSYCMAGGDAESGSNCTDDPLLQLGDIKISSVLSGTAYDAPRMQAAKDFLSNLFNAPSEPGVSNFNANVPVNAANISNDPTLKKSFVGALTDEALLSVVRQPFTEMMAKRTLMSDGPSEMQMMEQQAIQRFLSKDWSSNVKKMTALELQQEQAAMQAYQMWLEYQRYRQTERVEALLSVIALQNFRGAKTTNSLASQQPSAKAVDNAIQQYSPSSSTTSPNTIPSGTTE